MSRDLRIRVRTIGTEAARASIRRVTQETRAAATQQRQAARGRVSAEQQAAREIARAHAQMERQRVRETERSARAATRAVEREAANQRRAQQRAQQRAAAARARGRAALPGAVAATALAAGDAIIGRARGYQSSLGIQSRDQLVSSFVDRQERIIRLSAQSGVGADALQGAVTSASRGALTSQDDILAALETAQGRLVGGDTDLQFFIDHAQDLARASRAAGGSTEDWTVAVGQMQRQLGVASGDTEEMIGVMVAAARAGAIEAGDFAEQFSGILSQFRSLRGEQGAGIGGAREFGAVAQALGQGGRSPAEVRTLMQNMLAGLTRADTQRNIERRLGDRNVFDRNGTLQIGLGDLIQRMAADADFQSATGRQAIFGRDLQVNEAFTTLLNGARDGANPIGELQAVNAAEGQQVINDFFTQLEGSTAGEVLAIRSRAEGQFQENGGDLVAHEARLAAALSDVETRFPLATEAVGALRDIVMATTATFGALNLATGGALFGGAGAAAGGAGAAAAAGGGVVATGAAILGGGALLAAPLIAATAGTAGGDVSQEQIDAQAARRQLYTDSALGELRRVDSTQRGEVNRRAQAQAIATGRALTDEDIRQIAEAVRAGAAQGTAQGTATTARADRVTAGRAPTHTR